MGQVRKIDGEYYVEYYAQGLLFRKKGGKTLEGAERLLKQVEDSLPDPHRWYKTREDKLDDIFINFLKLIESQGSPATHVRFEHLTKDFRRFLALNFPDYQLISHITPRVLSRYVRHLSEEFKTKNERQKIRHINFRLVLLSEIFYQAINWGALNDNPVLHMKPFGRQFLSRAPATILEIDVNFLTSDDIQKKDLAPNVKKQLIRHLIGRGVRLIQIINWMDIKDIGRFSYFTEDIFGYFEKRIV